MIVTFPPSFTTTTLHTVWAQINAREKTESTASDKSIIDMTELTYFDMEGANYVALISHIVKEGCGELQILLPRAERATSFMRTCGLFSYLERSCAIVGPAVQDYGSPLPGRVMTFVSDRVGLSVVTVDDAAAVYRTTFIGRRVIASAPREVGVTVAELQENVYEHAEQPVACISMRIVETPSRKRGPRQLLLAVSDLGIGIRRSLREAFEKSGLQYSDLTLDEALLKAAIQPGISGTMRRGRGLGLARVAEWATTLRLRSGRAVLHSRNDSKTPTVTRDLGIEIPGMSVMAYFDLPGPL